MHVWKYLEEIQAFWAVIWCNYLYALKYVLSLLLADSYIFDSSFCTNDSFMETWSFDRNDMVWVTTLGQPLTSSDAHLVFYFGVTLDISLACFFDSLVNAYVNNSRFINSNCLSWWVCRLKEIIVTVRKYRKSDLVFYHCFLCGVDCFQDFSD